MMIELGNDDVGQHAEGSLAPGNGFCRRGCLHDLLAGPAAILGPDGPNDTLLHRHSIKHLVALLPQRPQRAAAVRTGAVTLLRFDPLLLAWQMGGQRSNRRWPIDRYWTTSTRGGDAGLAFVLFEHKLKLSIASPQEIYNPAHQPSTLAISARATRTGSWYSLNELISVSAEAAAGQSYK
ncbi:hypothetical protein [Sphingobium quisquiliarum]